MWSCQLDTSWALYTLVTESVINKSLLCSVFESVIKYLITESVISKQIDNWLFGNQFIIWSFGNILVTQK